MTLSNQCGKSSLAILLSAQTKDSNLSSTKTEASVQHSYHLEANSTKDQSTNQEVESYTTSSVHHIFLIISHHTKTPFHGSNISGTRQVSSHLIHSAKQFHRVSHVLNSLPNSSTDYSNSFTLIIHDSLKHTNSSHQSVVTLFLRVRHSSRATKSTSH